MEQAGEFDFNGRWDREFYTSFRVEGGGCFNVSCAGVGVCRGVRDVNSMDIVIVCRYRISQSLNHIYFIPKFTITIILPEWWLVILIYVV